MRRKILLRDNSSSFAGEKGSRPQAGGGRGTGTTPGAIP